MPVENTQPIVIPETVYGEWYFSKIYITPILNGNWRMDITALPARDTGEPLDDILLASLVNAAGEPRTRYEVLENESRNFSVPDLNALCYEKAVAGDTRFAEALNTLLALLTEYGKTNGYIT